jgi:hypothetical protein
VQEAKLKPLTFTQASGLLAASPAKRHSDNRSKATDSETLNITPANNFSQFEQFLCLQKDHQNRDETSIHKHCDVMTGSNHGGRSKPAVST